MEQLLDRFFNASDQTVRIGCVCVLAASFLLLRRREIIVRSVSSFLLMIAAFMFYGLNGLAWGTRDGLVPESMRSHGDLALQRFKEDFFIATVLSSIPCALALLLCYVDHRRNTRS